MPCQCKLCKSLKRMERANPKRTEINTKNFPDNKTADLNKKLLDMAEVIKKKGIQ